MALDRLVFADMSVLDAMGNPVVPRPNRYMSLNSLEGWLKTKEGWFSLTELDSSLLHRATASDQARLAADDQFGVYNLSERSEWRYTLTQLRQWIQANVTDADWGPGFITDLDIRALPPLVAPQGQDLIAVLDVQADADPEVDDVLKRTSLEGLEAWLKAQEDWWSMDQQDPALLHRSTANDDARLAAEDQLLVRNISETSEWRYSLTELRRWIQANVENNAWGPGFVVPEASSSLARPTGRVSTAGLDEDFSAADHVHRFSFQAGTPLTSLNNSDLIGVERSTYSSALSANVYSSHKMEASNLVSWLVEELAGDSTPARPSTSGSIGLSDQWAREDHSHPAQTLTGEILNEIGNLENAMGSNAINSTQDRFVIWDDSASRAEYMLPSNLSTWIQGRMVSALRGDATPARPVTLGSVGSSDQWAREDHAHPTQTITGEVLNEIGNLENAMGSNAIDSTQDRFVIWDDSASRAEYMLPSNLSTWIQGRMVSALRGDATPARPVTLGSVGSSDQWAREDHAHPTQTITGAVLDEIGNLENAMGSTAIDSVADRFVIWDDNQSRAEYMLPSNLSAWIQGRMVSALRGDATPLGPSTLGSIGASDQWAREDHRHPGGSGDPYSGARASTNVIASNEFLFRDSSTGSRFHIDADDMIEELLDIKFGQADLTGNLSDTDEVLVSDSGTIKPVNLSVLRQYAGGSPTVSSFGHFVASYIDEDDMRSGYQFLVGASVNGFLYRISASNLIDWIEDEIDTGGGSVSIGAGDIDRFSDFATTPVTHTGLSTSSQFVFGTSSTGTLRRISASNLAEWILEEYSDWDGVRSSNSFVGFGNRDDYFLMVDRSNGDIMKVRATTVAIGLR